MHIPARRRFIKAGMIAAALPAFSALDSHAQQADGIAYGTDARQRLDVYAPEKSDAPARAVIVYFYGGSWQAGQRADSRGVGQALAERGFVAIAPDYRVYPQTVFPGFLDDAALAVRWAHDHAQQYGGDPRRIVVMGHSAGAHIAAMLATDSRYLDARGLSKHALRGMIGLAGPYSAIPSEAHMSDIFPAALRSRALPIDFISGNEPPMLLATGTADTVVDPRNSAQFADALRAHDDTVVLKQYAGYGHGRILEAFCAAQRATSPVLADVAAFIESN